MFVRTPYDTLVNLNQYSQVKLEHHLENRHEIYVASLSMARKKVLHLGQQQKKQVIQRHMHTKN